MKRLIQFGLCLCICAIAEALVEAAPKSPNIIVILADDLGYGDLGCYGHPTIRTPNLDRMAAEGMRFTDFYVAACVCTPSRAGLLTGRLPVRSGMAGNTNMVLMRWSTGGLPAEEITIAEALKSRKYATACIGKWHLGQPEHSLPPAQGFDYSFGLLWSNDMEPAGKIPKNASSAPEPKQEWWNPTLLQNGKVFERPADLATLTKRYTEQAIKFIQDNKKGPFFLYFPHTYPHIPLFASEQFKGKSLRGRYGDAVEELDWSVGQILETLRKEKLAENTLVFFTSDNGPWTIKGAAAGSAGLLRDGKGSTWEGGMREPAIAWWPGKINAGTVNHQLACSLDLFNTCASLSGAAMPKDRPMDGFDMSAMLFDKGPSLRETVFYYYGPNLFAVRKGPYKLHLSTHNAYAKEPPVKHDPPLLFNVEEDPGESFDVAKEHPDVVADILREIEKHRSGMVPGAPQY